MRRLAIPAAVFFLFGGLASAQPRHERFGSGDEHDIRQMVDSMNSFWERGDARNYATGLSADTDWENAAGWRIRGREGVERFLGQYLWKEGARPTFRPVGERVRMLGGDLAVAEQAADASSSVEPGGPPRRIQEILFFRKHAGRWEVISTFIWELRQGPPPPRMPDLSPEPFRQ